MAVETIKLSDIRRDIDCQPRVSTDNTVVQEYAASMADGIVFPPIVVFRDGEGAHWLADGFYRTAASESAGRSEILAEIHDGDRRDAILYSVGVNSTHGVRRTNEDKERAVRTLLIDPEWADWSDREIARRCHVTHNLVARHRKMLDPDPPEAGSVRPRQISRSGQRYLMNTANISRKPIAPKTNARTTENAQAFPDDDMPTRQVEGDEGLAPPVAGPMPPQVEVTVPASFPVPSQLPRALEILNEILAAGDQPDDHVSALSVSAETLTLIIEWLMTLEALARAKEAA